MASYINYLNQYLGNDISVVDTLGYDGVIDEASIRVYTYDVASNGTTTILGEIPASEYTIIMDPTDKTTFTLEFNNAVTQRYVIEYLTSVPEISEGVYVNTAVVKEGVQEKGTYQTSVSYDSHDAFIDKEALTNETKVYTDDELDWKILVNESLSIIDNAGFEDTLSPGLVYKPDSLEIYRVDNGQKHVVDTTEYTFSSVYNQVDKTTTLKVKLFKCHRAYI